MRNTALIIFLFSLINCFFQFSLENDICKEQVFPILDCWLHYGQPPSCEAKSIMVLCAEERYDSVLNCSAPELQQVRRMVFSYGVLEAVFCDNSDLKTEIKHRESCWPVMRSCALEVMMVRKKDAEERCGDVMTLLSTCNRMIVGCENLYKPFIKSIINHSNCKNFRDVEAEALIDDDNDEPNSGDFPNSLFSTVELIFLGLMNILISGHQIY